MRSKFFSTSLAFAFLLLFITIASAGQEIRITPDDESGFNPAIYDNKIVWLDKYFNGSLHLLDLSTGKEIKVTGDPWYSYLTISNDKIFWNSGGQNISLYNISTNNKTLLSIPKLENQGIKDSLIMYDDKIVWRDLSGQNRDIYMYDLSNYSITRITTNQSTINPAIYENKIIWQNDPFVSPYHDIYVYNLSTSNETRITTNRLASNPKIYNDRIVYMGNNNIFLYNLSTSVETQITFNGSQKDKLAIYADRIVWQDHRNGNWDIYIYDLSTHKEIQVTTDESDQLNPAIYGDRIAWEDYRNDRENRHYCSIYMYDFAAKPAMPFASFSTNITSKSGNAPLTSLFSYNNTGGTPTSWFWDFGDGINSKHAQTAIHTFTKPGTYDVSLKVTNSAGSSTLKKSNYITVTSPQAPIADFFSPEVDHAETYGGSISTKTVSFIDNSTGSPTSWLWNFGDGNTSTEQNPTHVYDDVEGGYTINLTVKNTVGSNTTSKYGYVLVGLGDSGVFGPTYFSSSAISGDAPFKVTFYGGGGYSNDWIFGDGSQLGVNENQADVEHTYMEPGQYTVSLSEYNIAGRAMITKYHYINVTGLTKPVASFTSKKMSVPMSLTISFMDTSIGKPTSWYWDFGDGASSTKQNPTHTYSAAGNYTVSLTASNENSTNSTFCVINVFKTTGPFAYVTGGNNISVIDTATDKVVDIIEIGSGTLEVAVSQDGKKVYVTNDGNNVFVIDTITSKVIATVNGLNSSQRIAITPDGKKAYVANWGSGAVFENGTVSIIDTTTNTVMHTVRVGSIPHGVAITPDGKKAYVTNYYDISVIDTTTNKVTATLNVGQYPDGIAVSPDGKKVYVTDGVSDNISLIDTETNNVTATIVVGDGPVRAAVTPDGKKVYVTNYKGNTISVINTTTNTVIATVPGDGPYGVSVTPDGKKVYVTNLRSDLSGKTVSVIDTATNTVVATVNIESYPRGVAVSPK